MLRGSSLLCCPMVGCAGWLLGCHGHPQLSITKQDTTAAAGILVLHHPASRWDGAIVRLCVERMAGFLSTRLWLPIPRMLPSPEHGDPMGHIKLFLQVLNSLGLCLLINVKICKD